MRTLPKFRVSSGSVNLRAIFSPDLVDEVEGLPKQAAPMARLRLKVLKLLRL